MLSLPHIRPNLFISTFVTLGCILYLSAGWKDDSSKTLLPKVDEQVHTSLSDSLIAFAKTLVGHPYRAGGCSETEGFDCSGLVAFTFNEFNLKIGRSSRDQALEGYSVPVGEGRPGDIVVFARTNKKKTRVFHSGLIVSSDGDSLVMIHANNRNGVHVTNVTASSYWAPKLYDLRRIDRFQRP